MSTMKIVNESRRRFLQSGVGLTLALYLPSSQAAPQTIPAGKPLSALFEPNAFVRISEDNSVTVIAKHLEMGQGTYTGLATLVAEEQMPLGRKSRLKAPRRMRNAITIYYGVLPRARVRAMPWPTPTNKCGARVPQRASCWLPQPPRNGKCRQKKSASKTASSATLLPNTKPVSVNSLRKPRCKQYPSPKTSASKTQKILSTSANKCHAKTARPRLMAARNSPATSHYRACWSPLLPARRDLAPG